MKLNKKELKKISHAYNSICNRLLQSSFDDYNSVLSKFLKFIDDNEVIYDYILSCGKCDQDLQNEFEEVSSGSALFDLGETEQEEVRNVYAILKYIVQNGVRVYTTIGMAYSHSRKFQEIIKDFNDRVTMVLIRYIENYLVALGIDMGIDDSISYTISVEHGQVIIAQDQATITNQMILNNTIVSELQNALSNLEELMPSSNLSEEEFEICNDSIDVIKDYATNGNSKISAVKTALRALKSIKGTVEFTAAVATLGDLLSQIL